MKDLVGEKEGLVMGKKCTKKRQECVEKQLKEVVVERENSKNEVDKLRSE